RTGADLRKILSWERPTTACGWDRNGLVHRDCNYQSAWGLIESPKPTQSWEHLFIHSARIPTELATLKSKLDILSGSTQCFKDCFNEGRKYENPDGTHLARSTRQYRVGLQIKLRQQPP